MIKNFNIETLLGNNFESKIIYRGEEYYYENLVKSVIWNGNSGLEVTIVGTEIYSVTVNIKKGKIVDFSCNCPYEYHCKHEVAVLIYIWENLDNINSSCEFDNKQLKTLEKVIKDLPKQELEDLTLEFLNRDDKFRQYLLRKLKISEKNK